MIVFEDNETWHDADSPDCAAAPPILAVEPIRPIAIPGRERTKKEWIVFASVLLGKKASARVLSG
jgi:hypothetical protein